MRTILHVDMDAFFASVEVLCKPHLKGKPVIVCGNPERRSVVSAASYEARKYGINAGMPAAVAKRLCPTGVFVEGDPEKYIYFSIKLLEIYKRFTPLVEPFSIDEAFLELTGEGFDVARAKGCANEIKSIISHELGLSCSIGIGPNKYIAKMASSVEKPNGLNAIGFERFVEVFGDKPVDCLWGVGEKTKEKLEKIGIRKVVDILKTEPDTLKRIFGKYGELLSHFVRGEDETPLVPYFDGIEPKSMGHEHTFSQDVSDNETIEGTLLRLSEQVSRRLRKDDYESKTVRIKIRYSDFTTFTRQQVLDSSTDDAQVIFRAALRLYNLNAGQKAVRLLGVSACNLTRRNEHAPGLFSTEEKKKDLVRAVDSLRDRFGENVLARGMSLPSFLSRAR
ncbi:MAG: DNA polymerase IV [Candidatus Eisenbacteria bacterium]|nr:DNA polymerase IV [Candidatus Eisenbacteria bacterium]